MDPGGWAFGRDSVRSVLLRLSPSVSDSHPAASEPDLDSTEGLRLLA